MNRIRIVVTIIVLCASGQNAAAQWFESPINDLLIRIFVYGRHPSARGEAMGRGGAAINGNAADQWYNPAILNGTGTAGAVYSNAGPNLSDHEMAYHDIFMYGQVPGIGTVGAGMRRLHTEDHTGQYHDHFRLTFGRSLPFSIEFGTAVNYFRYEPDKGHIWPLTDVVRSAVSVDVGLQRAFSSSFFARYSESLTAGPTCRNVSFSEITGKGTADDSYYDFAETQYAIPQELPVILNGGVAYSVGTITTGGNVLRQWSISGTVEYQHTLNLANYMSGVRSGIALTLLDIAELRAGYFSMSHHPILPDTRWKDFTFGFGIRLPLQTITGSRVPVTATVDFVNQDNYSEDLPYYLLYDEHVLTIGIQYQK